MVTRLLSRLALTTVAAVGLYVPTLGLPPPGSCMRTGAVAGAAPAPSPSCGGDLRECLRQSADMRQTTFGGRYVTAEDVARCMEAFNACAHGGAGSGGNGPANPPGTRKPQPTSTRQTRSGLPEHFGITYGDIVSDCALHGTTLDCTSTWQNPSPGIDSWTADVTGELAGLTMTGTETVRQTGHGKNDPSCGHEQIRSGPITYTFSTDGRVAMHWGSQEIKTTYTGSCSSTTMSSTIPGWDAHADWS